LVIAGPQTVHNLTLRLSVLLARAHTLNLGTSVARLAVTAGAWAELGAMTDSPLGCVSPATGRSTEGVK